MKIRDARPILGDAPRAIYDVLARFAPGLMLDVGAAAGSATKFMLEASPGSKVIAFEPFQGNHRFFEARHGADPRVTLYRGAVGETPGLGAFKVGRSVTENIPGKPDRVGYSSLGRLLLDGDAGDDPIVEVPVHAIDDVVGAEHVRFLKIDVQGGELGVLKSAAQTIADGRLDIAFVETFGQNDIMAFMVEAGFQVYSHRFTLAADKCHEIAGWEITGSKTKTNGKEALHGFPSEFPTDPMDYAAFIRRERRRYGVCTDLICVRSGFVEAFEAT